MGIGWFIICDHSSISRLAVISVLYFLVISKYAHFMGLWFAYLEASDRRDIRTA